MVQVKIIHARRLKSAAPTPYTPLLNQNLHHLGPGHRSGLAAGIIHRPQVRRIFPIIGAFRRSIPVVRIVIRQFAVQPLRRNETGAEHIIPFPGGNSHQTANHVFPRIRPAVYAHPATAIFPGGYNSSHTTRKRIQHQVAGVG